MTYCENNINYNFFFPLNHQQIFKNVIKISFVTFLKYLLRFFNFYLITNIKYIRLLF